MFSRNSAYSVTKIFVITVKGFEPATFCVRNKDATTANLRDRIFKLIPYNASVIYQSPWLCWIHWIPIPFRENSNGTFLLCWTYHLKFHVTMIKVEKRKSVQSLIIVTTHGIQFNWYLFKEQLCDQGCLRASPRCKFVLLFVTWTLLSMITNSVVLSSTRTPFTMPFYLWTP